MIKSIIWMSLFFLFGKISAQSNLLDNRVIGEYKLLFHKNGIGEIIQDQYIGRDYLIKFTKSGQVIYDPKIILDDLKRNGIAESIDYTKIPKATWKTYNNKQIEIIIPGQPSSLDYYVFSGDTLILIEQKGMATYHLRIKAD